jgi:hypothetical protein
LAPSVVQAAGQPCTTQNSVAITLSAAPAPGNMLVAFLSYSQYPSTRTLTVPPGWTLTDTTTDSGLSLFTASVLWRAVQAGDGASWTFVLVSSGTDNTSGALYEVTGASTTAPVSQHAAGTNASSSSFTTPGLTPSALGCLPLTGTCIAHDGGSVVSHSPGWTVDVAELTSSDSTLAASGPLTADTVTPVQFTATNVDYGGPGVSQLVLIAPASSPPASPSGLLMAWIV